MNRASEKCMHKAGAAREQYDFQILTGSTLKDAIHGVIHLTQCGT